jgi:hypothetical protein
MIILEGPRLALGGVADEVTTGSGLGGDGRPLATGREPTATSPPQAGSGDGGDGCLRPKALGRRNPEAADLCGEVLVE